MRGAGAQGALKSSARKSGFWDEKSVFLSEVLPVGRA